MCIRDSRRFADLLDQAGGGQQVQVVGNQLQALFLRVGRQGGLLDVMGAQVGARRVAQEMCIRDSQVCSAVLSWRPPELRALRRTSFSFSACRRNSSRPCRVSVSMNQVFVSLFSIRSRVLLPANECIL